MRLYLYLAIYIVIGILYLLHTRVVAKRVIRLGKSTEGVRIALLLINRFNDLSGVSAAILLWPVAFCWFLSSRKGGSK
jgi:multisubunit Na+/H+ antiporter MnhC subunit